MGRNPTTRDDTKIDQVLGEHAQRLFRQFEAVLEPGQGGMFIGYTFDGPKINVAVFVTNDGDTGQVLRILGAARDLNVKRHGGPSRGYQLLTPDDEPGDREVSSIRVTPLGGGEHEVVRVWNRGALAGDIVVRAGDGETIAAAFGLVRPEPLGGEV